MERKKPPNKLSIFNKLILEQSELFNIDVGEKFFYNYKEIKKLQEAQKQSDLLKILNFNKKKIHSILYKEDEVINITINDKKIEKIFPLIHLCCLIEGNLNIVYYKYDFELINKLNIEQRKEKNNRLKKIIISKLINILINNYKGANDINIDEMNKIEDFNKKVIKENIETLKEYNLNEKDIYQKHIENIYLEIIKILIKKPKIDKDVIIDLEFESLPFNNIINELNKIIDKKEEYIEQKEINIFDDLFSDKMAFYYFLIKYIFKNPFFIYQNAFLNETRKKIFNLIKTNMNLFYQKIENFNGGDLKLKVVEVLNFFSKYQYYYEKSKSQYKIDKDKSHSNITAKNPLSNSDVREAQSQSNKSFDRQYNEDDKDDLAYRVLIKSTFKFHIEGREQEAKIKYDEIKIGDHGDKKNEDEIKNYKSNDKYNKFLKILKDIEEIMKNDIERRDNLKIILEFSSKDSKIFEKDNKVEIECKYKTENNQSSEGYKDVIILGERWDKSGLAHFIESINSR